MFGTPWHGDAGISSPASTTVTKIYFLEQFREMKSLLCLAAKRRLKSLHAALCPGTARRPWIFRSALSIKSREKFRVRFSASCPQQTAVEMIRRAEN